jgi:hypothetical protein
MLCECRVGIMCKSSSTAIAKAFVARAKVQVSTSQAKTKSYVRSQLSSVGTARGGKLASYAALIQQIGMGRQADTPESATSIFGQPGRRGQFTYIRLSNVGSLHFRPSRQKPKGSPLACAPRGRTATGYLDIAVSISRARDLCCERTAYPPAAA